MNKKLLAFAMIVIGQSICAAEAHKSSIARAMCDLTALVFPTLTSGKATPLRELDSVTHTFKEGVLETDPAKITAKDFVLGADGKQFVKIADNKYQPADENTPAEKKAIFTILQSAETNREKLINDARQEYHFPLSQEIFALKSKWWVERLYTFGVSALIIYQGVKLAQKLQDKYSEEQDEKCCFDDFEDEAEAIVEKIESAVKSEVQA